MTFLHDISRKQKKRTAGNIAGRLRKKKNVTNEIPLSEYFHYEVQTKMILDQINPWKFYKISAHFRRAYSPRLSNALHNNCLQQLL